MNNKFDIASFFKTLTTSAGVYLMYDLGGSIIYIGKAKNLRNRLRSYFYRKIDDLKTSALVEKISHIEVIPTPTEYDAIVLEDDLISQYIPTYNIKLHNKKYPYFALNNHNYPQLSITRNITNKNYIYLGPFTNPQKIKDFMRSCLKIFKLRTCSDFSFQRRKHPCIQYYIQQCTAPCVNFVSHNDYLEQVDHFRRALSGDIQSLINQLRHKMQQAASTQDFVRAAYYRDQILNCEAVGQNDFLDPIIIHSINYKIMQNRIAVVLISNKSLESEACHIEELPDYLNPAQQIHDLVHRFIYKYYLANNSLFPTTIILPNKLKVDDTLKAKLIEKATRNIEFLYEEKWQKIAILQASAQLGRMYRSQETSLKALEDHLDYKIKLIAGFDISHHQGEATVASCVYFDSAGEKVAKNRTYKLINIKNDDYKALATALELALEDWKKDNEYPDLLVIDGGKNHLAIVLEFLSHTNHTHIKAISISKKPGRISGQETIHDISSSYTLDDQNLAFLLLRQIRDSAHNLAIKTSGSMIRDNRMRSSLEKLPGIGRVRASILLSHFEDIHALQAASIEKLASILKINMKLAYSIWEKLQIL